MNLKKHIYPFTPAAQVGEWNAWCMTLIVLGPVSRHILPVVFSLAHACTSKYPARVRSQ